MSSTTNEQAAQTGPDGLPVDDIGLAVFAEEKLYTAVVSDSLDEVGIRSQAMREYLRPVYACRKFAGRARTIACSDLYHIPDRIYARKLSLQRA